jgi:hypothetical protein
MNKLILALAFALLSSPVDAAIRRLEIRGGWYGDVRIDGHYAVLVRGSHLQTATGRIDLPDRQNVLFPRIPPIGPFKIAGQDQHGRGNLEDLNGAWHLVGDSYGVNPVIYDWHGTLHQGALRFGSQGFRYVTRDGRIVTGDETYAHPSRRLFEYTTYGDVTIGQGATDGCVALASVPRVLEPGDCRAVRYLRIGDDFAVFMWKRLEGKGVLLWFARSDLSAFPLETTAPPPPPPPAEKCGDRIDNDRDGLIDEGCTPPLPPPADCGTVPDVGQAALRELWKQPAVNALVRSQHDDDRRKSARIFAEQMAFTVGPEWGTKNAGGGRPPSKDAIAKVVGSTLCGWDIVNGTTRELTFGHGEPLPGQEFINVTPTNHLGTAPPPPPPPSNCDALKAEVSALRGQLATCSDERNHAQRELSAARATVERLEQHHDELSAINTTLSAQNDALKAELADFKAQPEPTCTASLWGIRVPCKVIR